MLAQGDAVPGPLAAVGGGREGVGAGGVSAEVGDGPLDDDVGVVGAGEEGGGGEEEVERGGGCLEEGQLDHVDGGGEGDRHG